MKFQQVRETRYRLLETIRLYALEKLVEASEVKETRIQHLKFFVSLAEEIEPKLEHIDQQFWLDQVELEIDNLRTGLDWALENREVVIAIRLVSALRRFWFIRNHHSEGIERSKDDSERPDCRRAIVARLKLLNTYLVYALAFRPTGRSSTCG